MNHIQHTQQRNIKSYLQNIIRENQTFQALSQNALSDLISFFHLQTTHQTIKSQQTLALLRENIVGLCLKEKQKFTNFQSITNFQIINEDSALILKNIVFQLLQKLKPVRPIKFYENYVCKSKDLHYQEQFHLQIFHSLRMLFPTQPYIPQYPMPPPNFEQMDLSYPYSMQNPMSYEIERPQKKIVTKIQEGQQQNNYILQRPKEKYEQNFIINSFYFCKCFGNLSIYQKYFTCDHCHQKYHYKCLQIPPTAKIQMDKLKKSKCPFCFLKVNIFYEVFGNSLAHFYASTDDFNNKKLILKSSKCQQIVNEGLNVQIRILNIEGITICDSSKYSKLPLDTVKNFDEITLSWNTLYKNLQDDIKIVFSDDDLGIGNSEDNGILILACAFVVRQLTPYQIFEQIVQSSNQEYLSQFFTEGRTQLKFGLLNKANNLIARPGRGIDCNHYEIFDVVQFIHQVVSKQIENKCLICGKKCRTFVIDNCIENQFKKIKQQPVQNQPRTIFFQKNGTFKWGELLISEEDDDRQNIDPKDLQ